MSYSSDQSRKPPQISKTHRNISGFAWHIALLSAIACSPAFAAQELKFLQVGPGEFSFQTTAFKGRLGGEKGKGLSSVVHIPSGKRLDASMGLLSHYRVFSTGKRYGTGAWDWPFKAELLSSGAVILRWEPAADRPFEVTATYRLSGPTSIDLETAVTPQTALTGFEVFLASYFSPEFTNSMALASAPDERFVAAEQSRGIWQTFYRDDAATALFRDGRWQLGPSPVDWKLVASLSKPVGVRHAPSLGMAAVIMSMPQDAFAISTPHQTESHRSIYVSLFGRDLKAGQTVRARSRLAFIEPFSTPTALKAYEAFANQESR